MRDYGKVMTTFWTSSDMQELSNNGRMLALYLLTSPHTNLLGCFHLPTGYVSEDLKWSVETVSEGFQELERNGFATHDAGSKWVVIHAFLKWNIIENPNQGIAAGRLFEQVPTRSTVKPLLAKALRQYSKHFPKPVLDEFETLTGTVPPTVPKPGTVAGTGAVAGTEQDQENSLVGQPPPDPVPEIFAYWQKVMASPKSALDAKRKTLITNALKNYSPVDICKAIRGCSKSPHNMGKNDRNTKYNGLNLILRDAEHIDYFINLDSANAKPAAETIDEMNARIAAEFLGDGADENTIEMEA